MHSTLHSPTPVFLKFKEDDGIVGNLRAVEQSVTLTGERVGW